LAVLVLLLQACATAPPPRVADAELERGYAERRDRLQSVERWTVDGRIAVKNGGDGGSGSLRWQTAPDRTRLDFHGALGRGAWRLEAAPGTAVLTLADGSEYRAGSVDELVVAQIGWRVPVSEMSWWIRGLAAPGRGAQRTLGDGGILLALRQSDWTIEFDRYRRHAGEWMPGLVVAWRGEHRVKFAARDWTLTDAAPADG
jgi:outer membrane lipoprotein LolB